LADDVWLELLQAEDVDKFNSRRTERTRLELFAADLSGKKLCSADLSGANLEKSDLTGTDLSDANLMRANLGGIDGSGAILRDVLGLRARFKGAWMDKADLTGADLSQTDFADANLEGSQGAGVRMPSARLRGVNAAGASWPRADLAEARIHHANFQGADLRNADLTEVVAEEVNLSEARLEGITASGAKLRRANLSKARLSAARLPGAHLEGANLAGADLAAADLSRANLAGADLTGAVLRGAVLADANLEGATLAGADFSDADLTGLDPMALGLDAGTVGGLSGFGVSFDESAPLVFGELAVARNGDAVAVVWENPEGEPVMSEADPKEGEEAEPPEPEIPRVLRFALLRQGSWSTGVVPVPGATVLDHQVVAWADGFRIVVMRSRSEGAALLSVPLSATGALGSVKTVALGYEPAVRPVLRVEGERLLLYGLARRGPTVVIHDLTEEPRVVRSDATPTARGYMKGHPVLSCKGGVVIRVSATGPQSPRRTPEGYPGTMGTALPYGDDLLALWAVRRMGSIPGGLRYAVIGRRHAPKEEILGRVAGVLAMAALPREEGADVFWVEAGADGLDETRLLRATLPSTEVTVYDTPGDILELEVAPGVLALVVGDGELLLLDPATGRVLGQHPPAKSASPRVG
jgi:uncharacterized protein YjbI with pentapeptide repeats